MSLFKAHFNFQVRPTINATIKGNDSSTPAISAETDGTDLKFKFNRGSNLIFSEQK